MTSIKTKFGDIGEKAAAKYLKNKGYEILGFNFQNNSGWRLGEIDIIAKEKDEIVFVEVKSRDIKKYGDTLPEENITRSKLHKLAKIAWSYLRLHHLENAPYRFDAISVWLDLREKTAKIKHISHL
ncbi:MAG: YraN family protein [Parcubacteria group bacterium]|jgi:putative endonuclease